LRSRSSFFFLKTVAPVLVFEVVLVGRAAVDSLTPFSGFVDVLLLTAVTYVGPPYPTNYA